MAQTKKYSKIHFYYQPDPNTKNTHYNNRYSVMNFFRKSWNDLCMPVEKNSQKISKAYHPQKKTQSLEKGKKVIFSSIIIKQKKFRT
jgi:hypothetical protein